MDSHQNLFHLPINLTFSTNFWTLTSFTFSDKINRNNLVVLKWNMKAVAPLPMQLISVSNPTKQMQVLSSQHHKANSNLESILQLPKYRMNSYSKIQKFLDSCYKLSKCKYPKIYVPFCLNVSIYQNVWIDIQNWHSKFQLISEDCQE